LSPASAQSRAARAGWKPALVYAALFSADTGDSFTRRYASRIA
jgi:hypothetical protein